MPGSRLTLPLPRDFVLKRVVCSYGYFVLAPNQWDSQTQSLTTTLTPTNKPVRVRITQSQRTLRLQCGRIVSQAEQRAIKAQVTRVLRINDDMRDWYKLCPEARRKKFGRLFRSATLFEDIVKTITGCNVTWPNTVRMNALLCEHFGEDGAFPTPAKLARIRENTLKNKAKVGYRADRILRLARDVHAGRLDLDAFEDPGVSSEELFVKLKKIHGLGDYAAANLCMLLGHYDHLAIDSETYRHYCKVRNIERPKDPKTLDAEITAHYNRYQPYAFLAYWFELWHA